MEKFFNKIDQAIQDINPRLRLLSVLTVFLGIAAYTSLSTTYIYDPDSFYHIRHAWIYRTQGLFNSQFPWTYYSIIRTANTDLWYGFHMFLVPFTYIDNLGWAIKVAGLFITFFFLTSCYFAFKNLKFSFPFLLSVFLISSSDATLYRMSMTRPHPLSLGLTVLVFSFFYSGPAWLVFLFSFLISWLHSSFFWTPLVAIAPIVLFQILNRIKVNFSKIGLVLGGITAGIFARPNPLNSLGLVKIQLFDVLRLKSYELAAVIGVEMHIPSIRGLAWVVLPLLILVILSVATLVKTSLIKKEPIPENIRIVIISSFVLMVFGVWMFIGASRAIDILALFTTIFIGSALTYYLSILRKKYADNPWELKKILICFIIPLFTFTLYKTIPHFQRDIFGALPVDRFNGPAVWLKDNTNKGDIVFHLLFDQSTSLFFWNQNNYYTYGMDPVFLYKYDSKLYWEIYYLAVNDSGDETCTVDNGDDNACSQPGKVVSTYDAIAKDFKAKYVLTQKNVYPRFLKYLESHPKYFQKVYDKGAANVVYKVLAEK